MALCSKIAHGPLGITSGRVFPVRANIILPERFVAERAMRLRILEIAADFHALLAHDDSILNNPISEFGSNCSAAYTASGLPSLQLRFTYNEVRRTKGRIRISVCR